MPNYSVGVATTLTAASVPFMTIKAGAGSQMRITRIQLTLTSAVASDIAIARSATATTTPTIVLGQAFNPGDAAATGGVAVAWTTIGTANAISIDRVMFPATIGSGFVWTWSIMAPLFVPAPAATGEIMLVNRGAGVIGTFDAVVEWIE